MTRTKKKAHPAQKRRRQQQQEPAAAAAPVPILSVQELLVKSAQLIASLNYEGAKQACNEACHKANEEAQSGGDPRLLRDALEILGTVELELGEVEDAREVKPLPLSF